MTYIIAKGLLIPFLGTALGSALVFFMKKELDARIQKILSGFAAGVAQIHLSGVCIEKNKDYGSKFSF